MTPPPKPTPTRMPVGAAIGALVILVGVVALAASPTGGAVLIVGALAAGCVALVARAFRR